MSIVTVNLKPCPFCGNVDLIGPVHNDYIGDTPHKSIWIECGKCPCMLEVHNTDDVKVLEEAWNKRFVET